jgi:glyoxylase I family protein
MHGNGRKAVGFLDDGTSTLEANESTGQSEEWHMSLAFTALTPLLEVFDMPTSVRFYRDLLGFELVLTSHAGDHYGWALLRRDGLELMLNTLYENDERPPAPDPARVAAHADVSLFFACPDVDEAYRELRAKGLDLKAPVVRTYGMKQLSFDDPDGYNLCFQSRA